MSTLDNRGLGLSTSSDLAAEHYRQGVDLLLSAWPGAAEALDAAIAADPDFALAYAARARLHAVRTEVASAKSKIGKAEELLARHGTDRERSHVQVLSLAINGQAAKALERALEHADRWPRDILILSLPLGAFGLFAFSGMADHDQARVDLCERHAASFEANDWWFLTYLGWAHAENGNVAHGRKITERGYELRIENANAAHALSHAMYEGGASEDAERLISGWLPRYDRTGILHGHIAWHSALAALERDDPAHALRIYADYVQPSVSKGMPVNIVSDTASFLWRLQAYGHTVPVQLWAQASSYSDSYFQKPGFAFADVHMAVIAAAVGNKAAVEERVQALANLVQTSALSAGPVVPAICRAALSFAEENYADCVRILEPMAGEVVRIGGSGAQREMIEDMLLLSYMRSGDVAKARLLLDRRLHRRPSPRDTRWQAGLAA
ncbi:tetratricopeptide repeat protein [Allorhizobium undicola]|uniref:tetratricopeptide repeat protein n=1 Tax=Allorhizobium undicola TaxID=78527 RepID=UPI003D3333C1